MNYVIVSLTTVPCRKDTLPLAINGILKQKYVKKICINVDDNLTEEDYKFYDSLKELDYRIEINKCEARWRSCNKLLPTVKKYPNEFIFTTDDDMILKEGCIEAAVEAYEKHPGCIICHESNPVYINDSGDLYFANGFDVRMGHESFSKYLSNACLFPPIPWEKSDVFDYDKMMKLTSGTHDELWFWEQSFLLGVKCVCLDWTYTFSIDNELQHKEDDYKLTDVNSDENKIEWYNVQFNAEYKDKIQEVLKNKAIIIDVTKDNFSHIINSMPIIRHYFRKFNIVFRINNPEKFNKSLFWYLSTVIGDYGLNKDKTFVEVR